MCRLCVFGQANMNSGFAGGVGGSNTNGTIVNGDGTFNTVITNSANPLNVTVVGSGNATTATNVQLGTITSQWPFRTNSVKTLFIGGSQGVSTDPTTGNIYLIGTSVINKYDPLGNYTGTNITGISALWPGLQSGLVHLGDGTFNNGFLYVSSGSGAANDTNTSISIYETTNLNFVSWVNITNFQGDCPAVAIDNTFSNLVNPTIFSVNFYNDSNTNGGITNLFEYKLSGITNITPLQKIAMSSPITNCQGLACYQGQLYAMCDFPGGGGTTQGSIFTINETNGAVIYLGTVTNASVIEWEGIDANSGYLIADTASELFWFNLPIPNTVIDTNNNLLHTALSVADLPTGGRLNPIQMPKGISYNIVGTTNFTIGGTTAIFTSPNVVGTIVKGQNVNATAQYQMNGNVLALQSNAGETIIYNGNSSLAQMMGFGVSTLTNLVPVYDSSGILLADQTYVTSQGYVTASVTNGLASKTYVDNSTAGVSNNIMAVAVTNTETGVVLGGVFNGGSTNQPLYSTSLGVFGTSSEAFGIGANALGGTAIAAGESSFANGNNSVALGYAAGVNAGMDGGIAIGEGATVSGSSGIAIGKTASATANQVVIGTSGITDTYLYGSIHGNGSGLTNLNATNITGTLNLTNAIFGNLTANNVTISNANFVGNLYIQSTNILNLPTNTTVGTNYTWVDGAVYTNTSSNSISISASAYYTLAAVNGDASEVEITTGANAVTNPIGASTTVAVTVAASFTNAFPSALVAPGGTLLFTNKSSGAGNVAGVIGGQYSQNNQIIAGTTGQASGRILVPVTIFNGSALAQVLTAGTTYYLSIGNAYGTTLTSLGSYQSMNCGNYIGDTFTNILLNAGSATGTNQPSSGGPLPGVVVYAWTNGIIDTGDISCQLTNYTASSVAWSQVSKGSLYINSGITNLWFGLEATNGLQAARINIGCGLIVPLQSP